MNGELLDFYRTVDADDDIRVVVVTGAGRAFCAGMDLSEGGATFASEQSAEEYRDLGGQVSNQIYEVKKPVIA
ncbi:enoyl-CoA hydratase-related protein, partial [Halomonas sp. SIMBA_159]